jgi:hypothetical protein
MTDSSNKLPKEELLGGLESLHTALSHDAGTNNESTPEIPTLNDVVLDIESSHASSKSVEFTDLDSINVEKTKPEKNHADVTDPESNNEQPLTVDQLLNRAFAITIPEPGIDDDNKQIDSTLISEALQLEAETIRDELLLKHLPQIEQEFRQRLAATTRELLSELIEEKMQERLRGYK